MVPAIRVGIRALDVNFEVDGRGQNAPLTSRIGAEVGFIVLMDSFIVIQAHVSRGFRLPADRRSGQTGIGGARNRAMRARICPNIRRDTATSANWNVTYRP